eukprot:1771049-Pyramimonas_sp.AAC.1
MHVRWSMKRSQETQHNKIVIWHRSGYNIQLCSVLQYRCLKIILSIVPTTIAAFIKPTNGAAAAVAQPNRFAVVLVD